VRDLKASECRALLGRACDCATAGEVEELLRSFGPSQSAPLIDEGLVVLDSDARTKEEAIKEAVDRLYVAGRTERPREVEDAAWRREAVHSTGFGYGFAIPHCRTGAVTANSLVLTRLRKPVDWGAADDKPVGVLLLLAVRERDQASADMKILATLTRQLVHEEFRGRLSRGDDPAAVCRLLRGRVGDT
jgi:fructose-specific phosphotransferase system IIA component